MTPRLGIWCSILLSYEDFLFGFELSPQNRLHPNVSSQSIPNDFKICMAWRNSFQEAAWRMKRYCSRLYGKAFPNVK